MSSTRTRCLVAGLALLGTFAFPPVGSAQGPAETLRPRVVTTEEAKPVSGLLPSSDAGSATLTFSIVSQPVRGVVVLDDAVTGAFTYMPNLGTFGYDPFIFEVHDGVGVSQATQMVFVTASAPQWPGQTVRASVSSTGVSGNGGSIRASISADGRYVAFESQASNLGGGGGAAHVFVRDRLTNVTTRVSGPRVGAAGAGGNSTRPSISADGRYVAFHSFASNLVLGDTNSAADVFVRDRVAEETTRVSVASGGTQVSGDSSLPSISADGRFVVFESVAANVVANDTNNASDIFVHDRMTGETTRVSVSGEGTQANGSSAGSASPPGISADGRYVVFESVATNLVTGDTNNSRDIFVHDRVTDETTRVSVSSGVPGNFASADPSISADGHYVVFRSLASNLVTGDANGTWDAFVHNRITSETTLVSVSSEGVQGNATIAGTQVRTSMSADGRYVAFLSGSPLLVDDDTNGLEDVFVHDRLTATTTRVSVNSSGAQAVFVPGTTSGGLWPSISADGRSLAFESTATNLVENDTSTASDVFVVGGVSVTPLREAFEAAGGTGAIGVAFAYPGTNWTAISEVNWITITGQSSLDGNGTVSYAVAPNTGEARVGTLIVAAQKVTIEQEADRALDALDGAVTTDEDMAVAGTLGVSPPAPAPLTFALVTNGTLGTALVTDASTGAFTYTPNLNLFGVDTFTFHVSNGATTSNLATVTVTISPVNDSPVAVDGALAVVQNTPVAGTVAANDVDGPAPAFVIVTNGTKGTAVMTNAATGAYNYTPTPGATGADSFTFQASDGLLASNVATVSVTITPVAAPPVADAGVITTPEVTPVQGVLQASDANNDPLTFSLVAQPAGGSVVIDNPSTGAFTYTPSAGTNGYDPFPFQVSDGSASSQATELVFVTANSPRWPGQTIRASVSSAGAQGNNQSFTARLSADGRYVAFASQATNFAVGTDTNGVADVFVRDRVSGVTTRLSVANGGAQANGGSSNPAISADGRFVAFQSAATTLVANDTNGADDIFGHDRTTGQTTRVSVSSTGTQASGHTTAPSLSADGRYVAFQSLAANLVSNDTNGVEDVFVHDRATGTTTRVSVSSAGAQGDSFSRQAAISADGASVVFISNASTLVAGVAGVQVFVHDRRTGETTRVSRSSAGVEANNTVSQPTISADGRYVAFESLASNLVNGDTNGQQDVFVHDRATGTTTRVSVANAGPQGDGSSERPVLSADGRFVAFQSLATTLVAGDTNGEQDAFVHDRLTGVTRRVSVSSAGAGGNIASAEPSISADGRFVAFYTQSNLVGEDTNNQLDVFVVGGVLVTPTRVNAAETGGTAAIDVSFVYPGTAWASASQDAWITITDQSSTTGNGTVTYTVAPNTGAARVGTLTVATHPVVIAQEASTAPVAQNGAVTTSEGLPVNGTLVATDPNSDPLTFSIVANGALGTAVISDVVTGAFVYTPNSGATGEDHFTFQASDGVAASNIATVVVTIEAAPLAVTLVAPAGGEKVFIGTATSIQWSATASSESFDVELSRNAGATFVAIPGCTSLPGSTTSCSWTPLAPATSNARVRVTGHRGGGTAAAMSATNFQIATGTPTLTVTTPNTSPAWIIGTPQTIRWTHNLGANSSVRVELSRDNGASWEVLGGAVPNASASSGNLPWQVTGPGSTVALIRVTWLHGPATDVSNAVFSIAPPTVRVTAPNTAVTWRVGNTQTLGFTHNAGVGQSFSLDASHDGGSTWSEITALTTTSASSATYPWTVTGPATANARIRVRWARDAAVADMSDVSFVILSRVNVTAPSAGDAWVAGSIRTIQWSHNLGTNSAVDLAFSPDEGATWAPLTTGVVNTTAASGVWTGALPAVVTSHALIRVSSAANPADHGVSAPFMLIAPTVTLVAPNTAVAWRVGTTQSLRFTHSGGVGQSFSFDVSRNGGTTWSELTTLTTTGASVTYAWTVAGPPAAGVRIRARWAVDATVADVSDVGFTILPSITVTAPNTGVTWGAGSTRTVMWTHAASTAQPVDIALSPDGGATWVSVAVGVPSLNPTTGSWTGPLPAVVSAQALVRVSAAATPTDADVSNVAFTLAAPALALTAPISNVSWGVGTSRVIRWTHNLGTAERVHIDVSRDGGTMWERVASDVANGGATSGSFNWVVTGPPTAAARLRVVWASDTSVQSAGVVSFRIN